MTKELNEVLLINTQVGSPEYGRVVSVHPSAAKPLLDTMFYVGNTDNLQPAWERYNVKLHAKLEATLDLRGKVLQLNNEAKALHGIGVLAVNKAQADK